MTRQNRVDPYGRILALPGRGRFMGNRGGQLHDGSGAIVRDQVSRTWIICLTEFKQRAREVGAPGRYTELFFLDEATALSAGHRPCFECRRPDATHFLKAWRRALGSPDAPLQALDAALSRERRVARASPNTGKRGYLASPTGLPDGATVDVDAVPHLVLDGGLLPWTNQGYGSPRPLTDHAWVLTPRPTVAILAAGYRPHLDGSARGRGCGTIS